MDIVEIKKKLYGKLKNFNEVIGSGIRERNGIEYIVIYLSKASKKVKDQIPSEFEGYKVLSEIKGKIEAF